MPPFLRSLLAVLAGLVVGVVLVGLVETLGHLVFPPPEGVDSSDPDALASLGSQIPAGALVSVLVAWFVGTAAGMWTAIRLHPTRERRPGIVVGVLLLAFAALTMLQIPHPLWFVLAAVVTYALAAGLALRLAPPTREMVLSGRR